MTHSSLAPSCAVPAPADLFSVCGQGPWVRKETELRFLFAGVVAYTFRLPALILNAPFTRVNGDAGELPPPPAGFPNGIEAARIFACPMRKTRRAIRLSPQAIRYLSGQGRHFYIDLAGSFDDYLQKFAPRTRSTLRRKVKRFCTAAGLTEPLREFSRPEEMAEFHRLATEVSVKTYQHRLLDAALPISTQYLCELTDQARRGNVRGFVLMHGNKPAAYCLCQSDGDTFTMGKTGFDAVFASLHPGTVMMYLIIERIFAERRYDRIDFGNGDFGYKEFLATGHTWCGDVVYLARTPRNLAVVLTHYALNLATDGLKKLADLIGVKARLKKTIHHGMSRVS